MSSFPEDCETKENHETREVPPSRVLSFTCTAKPCGSCERLETASAIREQRILASLDGRSRSRPQVRNVRATRRGLFSRQPTLPRQSEEDLQESLFSRRPYFPFFQIGCNRTQPMQSRNRRRVNRRFAVTAVVARLNDTQVIAA